MAGYVSIKGMYPACFYAGRVFLPDVYLKKNMSECPVITFL